MESRERAEIMPLRRRVASIVFAVALLCLAGEARASTITWTFAGVFDAAGTVPGVTAGAGFTGSLTFDSAMAVPPGPGATFKEYFSLAAPAGLELTAGGTTYTQAGIDVLIFDVSSQTGTGKMAILPGFGPERFRLTLYFTTPLADPTLPLAAPALSSLLSSELQLTPAGGGVATGHLTALAGGPSAVPEPGSLAAAGLGVAALAGRLRRRAAR